jgi:prolyl 4-hydroxylase
MTEVVSRADTLIAAGQTQRAVALLRDAAEKLDVDALFRLATWHLIGSHVQRDHTAARALLSRAVAIGHVDAALMEIAMTANGSGGAADWGRAVRLLRTAAKGDAVAAAQLELIEAMALDEEGRPQQLPTPDILSQRPGVKLFPALLTQAECEHLARVGAAALEPASVIDPQTGRRITHPVRTSDGSVIGPAHEDLVVRAINLRIAAVSETGIKQGEPLLILRYRPGQQYRLHHDCIANSANQRIKTLLVYLNGGFAGGETEFPSLKLKIRPRGGDALLFDNVRSDGSPEPLMRHAGLPVLQGSKWLATRWIRANPYDPWNADQFN